jgi:hypothetical protein
MKRISSLLLGLALTLGTTAAFGLPQQDQPKAEKKKLEKAKNTASDKGKDEKSDKGKGKDKSNNGKRKAEQPKAQ